MSRSVTPESDAGFTLLFVSNPLRLIEVNPVNVAEVLALLDDRLARPGGAR